MGQMIADRLQEARERAKRSVRSLQKQLHVAGVPGSSYANVHAYFSGKTTPPVGFLAAAAEVLGVHAAWLAFGQGHPTDQDALAASGPSAIDEEHLAVAARLDKVRDALRDGFPLLAREMDLGSGAPSASRAAWEAWDAACEWEAERQGTTRTGSVAVARKVGEAFQAPLDLLGIRYADLSPWQLASYATLVGQALQVVTATPWSLARTAPPGGGNDEG